MWGMIRSPRSVCTLRKRSGRSEEALSAPQDLPLFRIRDLAADLGEGTLGGVGKVLLFGLKVRLTSFRSPAQTLAYALPNLLSDDMRLEVLTKILHVRSHAPSNLEHLLL
jgi:hypothetical protein